MQNSAPIALTPQQLCDLIFEVAVQVLDLIRLMVNGNALERPSVSIILSHSFLTKSSETVAVLSVASQTEPLGNFPLNFIHL